MRCGRGALLDVAVDLRRDSSTYGRWHGTVLTAENDRQMMIPAGFARGIATREPDTEIIYKCSDYYAPETEGALRFDDPDLGIDWQFDDLGPILSDKAAAAGSCADFDSSFTYRGNGA